MRIAAALFLLLSLLPRAASAQDRIDTLTPDQVRALVQVKYGLATIDDLEKRGVLAHAAAESERERCRLLARTLLGNEADIPATLSALDRFVGAPAPASDAQQKHAGFFTFLHIIWFLASALLVIATAWLARIYLLPILALVPVPVYEVLSYLACAAFLAGGTYFTGDVAVYVALPGCLGVIAALGFSHFLHREALKKFFEERKLNPVSTHAFLLLVVWTGAALAYRSTVIGFLAVAALQAWMGFSVLVMPLCYCIGFRDKKVIPRAMSAAFVLLAAYVTLRLLHSEDPTAAIFAPGALFLGAFVYFTGCLIVSSKWYRHETPSRYYAMQALTLASGVAALFIGSVWDIGTLQGIGGTFFFLWVMEKYFELPWSRQQMAWIALGFALLLYLGAFTAHRYPQYFLFGG